MQKRSGALFLQHESVFFSREPPSAFSGTAFHPGKNRDAGIWRIRFKNYGLTRIRRYGPDRRKIVMNHEQRDNANEQNNESGYLSRLLLAVIVEGFPTTMASIKDCMLSERASEPQRRLTSSRRCFDIRMPNAPHEHGLQLAPNFFNVLTARAHRRGRFKPLVTHEASQVAPAVKHLSHVAFGGHVVKRK